MRQFPDMRSKANRRRRSAARCWRFEPLEPRLLLAQATVLQQQFREDDFSVSGNFTYRLEVPEMYDFIDQITNGNYASTAGHIAWTSPADGTGYFQGQATGNGKSTVWDSGSRWGCADYTIEDKGRFDFTIDAGLSELNIDIAHATSTRYTYYRDLTAGRCPAESPVRSRFFGGNASLYQGTFDASTQRLSVHYEQAAPATTANAPATAVQWATTAPTDLELTITPHITVPAGWAGVTQTTVPPTVDVVDLAQGLAFTVAVHGKPVATSTVLQPVGTVRLYWASSATDTTGAEIPVTTGAAPLGVYWNSSQMHAVVEQLPTAPAGATYIRVKIDAPTTADANATNSSRYLRIENFQAGDSAGGPVSEDALTDGQTSSVLAPADRANPDIKVYSYQPLSDLGAAVQVVSDTGGYVYDPRSAPAVQALALGETADDVVRFQAVKQQRLADEAAFTITVQGANDAPVAGGDAVDAPNFHTVSLAPASLLANDADVDHNDTVTLQAVAGQSQRGATVRAVWDGTRTNIVEMEYDPSASSTLKSLAPGQQLTDTFDYTLVDTHGATATGRVTVTVTGEQPVTIGPVLPQLTTSDQPTDPIELRLTDPDGDASELAVTALAADSTLIPPGNLQLSGAGDVRSLVVTPVAGLTGRTHIQVTATDDRGRSATMTFWMIVGLADDLDLDGVPNAVEAGAANSGDGNHDGILDERQPDVASLPSPENGSYFTLVAAGGIGFTDVHTAANPSPGAAPADVQFPLGFVDFALENGPQTKSVTVSIYVAPATPLNTFYRCGPTPDRAEPHWYPFLFDGKTGAKVFADRIQLYFVDGQRGDDDLLQNGRIEDPGAPGFTAYPWRNPSLPCDVDNDGFVRPVDVLIVINALNATGPRDLPAMPEGTGLLPPYLDTSKDNRLAPVDALTVINYINANPSGEGEAGPGGGESGLLVALGAEAEFSAPAVVPAEPAPRVPSPRAAAAPLFGESERAGPAITETANAKPRIGAAHRRGVSRDGRPRRAAAEEFDSTLGQLETLLPDIAAQVACGWERAAGAA